VLLAVVFMEVDCLHTPTMGSLPALLATLPDPRGRKGLRHPLAAMLAATVCGILTGARGCEAIAQWVRDQESKIWHLLGFRRNPPCANTYRNLLARMPADQFEELIQRWIEPLITAPVLEAETEPIASSEPAASLQSPQAMSMDGKTLCGTLNAHGRSVHLLSLFDQQSGGVLRQLAMPSHTNEHKAALTLLKSVMLKGKLITGDAMFCQRDLCQQVVDQGGDYLIVVKENQPELLAALRAEFQPGFSPL
jgi:DDE family transposase